MYHFFAKEENICGDFIKIYGSDVNHIRNVLRMKCGEKVIISSSDVDYYCRIENMDEDCVTCHIDSADADGHELKSKIYLFQGLPKSDKMELIIQKSVELGVYEIIPVATKRAVVKLDDKKEQNKIKRWNAISEAAAKQSKRSIIPEVTGVMTFREAVEYAKTLDVVLMPYENEKGMEETKRIIEGIVPGQSIGVFIGPEGGFDDTEVQTALDMGMKVITLGKRILRTETAGLCTLSILMFYLD